MCKNALFGEFNNLNLSGRHGGMVVEIDWSNIINTSEQKEIVSLREAPIGEVYAVKFNRVFNTNGGSIAAEVETELNGELLWLYSEQHGGQNGLLSLVKAAGVVDGQPVLEGKTFNFSRVESEKSPVGYAFLWTE